MRSNSPHNHHQLINSRYLPGEHHNVFHLREDRSGILLTDDWEVHFMNCPSWKRGRLMLAPAW